MKYQGKEMTTTLQANTAGELNTLVSSARKFANAHGMDNFRVLERGKDQDGGYRAIITAHNWNPISWIKEKIRGRGEPTGAPELNEGTPETREERKAREKREKEARKEQERIKKEQEKAAEAEKKREAEEERKRWEAREEEALKEYPPWERERMRKGRKTAYEHAGEAAVEVLGQGVPEKTTRYYKMLQKEYWTDKETGQTVPEPRTAEERARTDYHPSQWVFQPVEQQLSMPERLQIARTLEADRMEMEVLRGKYKDWKRDRSFSGRAARTVAGGLGAIAGIGATAMGAATMGVAGVARSTQGSPRGRERAARMHAPGVPMELYGVRPMLGVGIPPARVHTGSGLEHLRALTLPGVRRTRQQVRQTARQVREDY